MKGCEENLIIDVFLTDDKPGSPQYLHFFSTKEKMLHAFNNDKVEDEFDHSFIYLDHSMQTHILWKNKAGPIQFCGSGAYAAAWFLMNKYNLQNLKLNSQNLELKSYIENNKCYLEMPSRKCSALKKTKEGDLYFNEDASIFLFHIKNKKLLNKNDWIERLKLELEENEKQIHGLCLFYWNKDKERGSLRYFVPWHGRDEDYVTGSIHQYLTPLIYELTDHKNQHWLQSSNLSGELLSCYSDKTITITGNSQIKSGFFSLD